MVEQVLLITSVSTIDELSCFDLWFKCMIPDLIRLQNVTLFVATDSSTDSMLSSFKEENSNIDFKLQIGFNDEKVSFNQLVLQFDFSKFEKFICISPYVLMFPYCLDNLIQLIQDENTIYTARHFNLDAMRETINPYILGWRGHDFYMILAKTNITQWNTTSKFQRSTAFENIHNDECQKVLELIDQTLNIRNIILPLSTVCEKYDDMRSGVRLIESYYESINN